MFAAIGRMLQMVCAVEFRAGTSETNPRTTATELSSRMQWR
jgi:hypothetical protein